MYCKNCRYWDKYDNSCNLADWYNRDNELVKDEIMFYAEVNDDSGLRAGVRTGPEFGCIKFEIRKNRK